MTKRNKYLLLKHLSAKSMKVFKNISAVAFVSLFASSYALASSFNGTTLTIPEVQVNGNFYSATLDLTGNSPIEFTLTGAVKLSSGNASTAASFTAGILSIPSVSVGLASYSVNLNLVSGAPAKFQLQAISPISGGGSNGGGSGGGNSGTLVGSINSNGNGNCVNVNSQQIGRLATYRITTNSGPSGVTEYTEEYLESTPEKIRFLSEITSDIGGVISNSETETTINFVVQNDWRYLSSQEVDASVSVNGFATNTTTTATYTPPILSGAVSLVCELMMWESGISTQEIVTTNAPTVTGSYGSQDNEIEAINVSITVMAGTFNTVRSRHDEDDGYSLSWFDIDTGFMVKSEHYDSNGNLDTSTEMIDLQ